MSENAAVLVIDDELDRLEPFVEALRAALNNSVQIRSWQPKEGEDPIARFNSEIETGVALIATDQDLTKSHLGLLGSSITSWAQDRFIPVCNFSRKPKRALPRERNFFELRVPPEPNEDSRAAFIARMYHGFQDIRGFVASGDDGRPGAGLLAGAMGLPEIEDDVAPFLASVASANSTLMQSLALEHVRPTEIDRVNFLTFILGYVLVNAVLEFPGPILSKKTLAAYCAVSDEMENELTNLFVDAAYEGPFSSPGMYFQRRLVDLKVDYLADSGNISASETDQYTRAAVEYALGSVTAHGCDRCEGIRGGYWCPFTQRAVCNRKDCSIPSNEWFPRGATLCRVEHDYYEELAPLLGE